MQRVYHLRHSKPPLAVTEPITHDTVPLSWAGVCMDCAVIRDVRLAGCPRCGSAAALPLARVLGTEAA